MHQRDLYGQQFSYDPIEYTRLQVVDDNNMHKEWLKTTQKFGSEPCEGNVERLFTRSQHNCLIIGLTACRQGVSFALLAVMLSAGRSS